MQIIKTLDLSDAELKFDEKTEEGTFSGYASKFNSVDLAGDTIAPGAWTKAIEKIGVLPIFFNHASDEVPIGKYTKVEQNARGLKVEGKLLLSIPKAKEVYEAMKAGIVSGLSVGFTCEKGGFEEKADGTGFIFKDIARLHEVSVCTFPCEPKAQVLAIKSEAIESVKSIRDVEQILRDAGLSKSQALALVSKVKGILREEAQRESELKTRDKNRDAFLRLVNSL